MHLLLGLVEHHAYSLLFWWVLMEQGGIPIPTVPLMLALGTMSAAHRLHVALALPITVLACLISDSAWFFLGRRYGTKILDLLCKLSMEAATCVSRTEGQVQRRGALTLLFAKFVPGLSTMAPPIAGQSGISYPTFLAYDAAGSLMWASAWLFAGRFFGDLAKRSSSLFGVLRHFGVPLVVAMVIAVLIYRYVKKQQFLHELRGLRLEPEQLLAMIADAERAGLELPFIVDLRHPLDVLTDPLVLPGALRIGPDELKLRKDIIPHDRDVVLYCTCPSEETSAKVALELRRMGVKRVRPLRGGLQGWKDAGYPLDAVLAVQ
jgi:membrane protein DedA with SNARE-associated domain/rhodanese-related sulfurtransferase